MQRQFWLLWQVAPAGPAYNIPALFHLRGQLDTSALVRALENLVRRHEALRTTFAEREGELHALVHDALPFDMDVSDSPVEQAELQSFFARPFDLGTGPLMRARLAPARQGGTTLALVFHHIAVDLRTKELLARDINALYAEALGGAPLPPVAYEYASVAAEERALLAQEDHKGGLDHFAGHLTPLPEPLALPAERARANRPATLGARERFAIDGDLAVRLKRRAAAIHGKPFLILLTNWALLLARTSRVDRIAVGVPFSNRRHAQWADTVGCFVTTLPLVVDIGDNSFDQLVAQVRGHMLGHHRHQEIPLQSIVSRCRVPRDPGRNPIYQAGFTFEPPMSLSLAGGEVVSTKVHVGGTQMDVFMTLWETESGFEGQIEYASELFASQTIAAMARNFEHQLGQALDNGSRPALTLPWVAPEERDLVVRGFNQTDVAWPNLAPIHVLFLRQAEATPDAIALSMGERVMTYAQLRKKALALAAALAGQGVAKADLVGVYMLRSMDMLPTLLGVLLAGAAYVPIDPEYPAQRVQHMLEDAKPRLVLGHKASAAEWPADRALFRDVEDLSCDPSRTFQPPAVAGEDWAYVIFTSGSTGRPKGAANTHGGIANRILWMQDRIRLTADDVGLQKTPYSFDISTLELFWPVVFGARLEMSPPGVHRDPLELARLIQRAGVTTAHFVPSMLQAFLDHPESRRCTGLRRIVSAGEALSPELVRRCWDVLPIPLENVYGPTEAAVDVTAWSCNTDRDRSPVPIGRPTANNRLYVLDQNLEPVPVSVPGELYIGGGQVAAGYVNRPELTAERFLPDPFSSRPGARLYRTGDLARWDRDGQIIYLGRLDSQVKIRGLRIELGEIEAVLDRCAGVKKSVVVALCQGQSEARIVAYLVTEEGPVGVAAIRAQAAKVLPTYMLPQQFVHLDRFPLNVNGKVDRKALPLSPMDAGIETSPAEGKMETWLVGEWQRLLNLPAVGRDTNFFELGGSSVTVARLVGRVREHLGLDVPLVSFFEFPTVAGLAEHLESILNAKSGSKDSSLADARDRAMRRRAASTPRPRRPQ
jgi:amino acid adenylation domain-containing protein